MYNPSHFQIANLAAIRDFIHAHPLATLVANQQGQTQLCPVPLLWQDDGSKLGCLIGHVAKANPITTMAEVPWQVQFLDAGHYISPNWYPTKAVTHKEVPTWNYQTVQLTVIPTLYTDATMVSAIVGCLTDHFEQQYCQAPDTPWSLHDAPADYIAAMCRAIVGVKLRIEHIEAKFKLSQNKSTDNRQGVVTGLTRLDTAAATHMARLLTNSL